MERDLRYICHHLWTCDIISLMVHGLNMWCSLWPVFTPLPLSLLLFAGNETLLVLRKTDSISLPPSLSTTTIGRVHPLQRSQEFWVPCEWSHEDMKALGPSGSVLLTQTGSRSSWSYAFHVLSSSPQSFTSPVIWFFPSLRCLRLNLTFCLPSRSTTTEPHNPSPIYCSFKQWSCPGKYSQRKKVMQWSVFDLNSLFPSTFMIIKHRSSHSNQTAPSSKTSGPR